MQFSTTNIEDLVRKLAEPWSPVDVARVNNHIIRLALFEGEYHWHVHDADELFLVHRGEIVIQRKGYPDLLLKTGEIGVVPKGVEHCPKSAGKSFVLMFEPVALESEVGNL
ncbi:MAG: cupin domain-containing protein [Candidatus Peregrinibacteria bacterium]|nr:cupin domain-containing protein [Candidatus Peregrinibacteria bacterium]